MGTTTALKQLLKGLCHGTQWKYAVFWKLKGMELTWEDGYFDNENSGGFLSGKPGMLSFGCGIDIKGGNSLKCPVEMAVASLSCRSYPLGEGIVGKAASKRKHHWTYVDETDSRLQEEFPEEWNLQYIAGIKTILLVPVIPHGVVQLGSFDMVLEDLRDVIHVIDCFGTIQNTSGTCISLSPRMDQPDSYTPFVMPLPFMAQADLPLAVDVIDQILGADTGPCTDESKWQSAFSNLFADHIEEPPTFDLSVFTDHMIEGDMSASYLENELNVISSISQRSISRHPIIQNPYVKDLESKDHDQGFRKVFDEEMNSIIDHKRLSFPSDSELHKALGLSPKGHDDHMWNTILSKADEWSNSMAFCQMELPEVCSPMFEDADAWFPEERGTEQLLDDVIAKLLNPSDDNESFESKCVRSSSNSSSKCSDSCLTHCKTDDDALDLGESVSRTYKRSMLGSDIEGFMNSPTISSVKTAINIPLSTEQEDMAYARYKKGPKSTNVSRKKGHAGDVRKPKPRDRQLIQDRIKELRELIPDGSKCSIDALLDRTIKHMMFLQCVPSQAEKLRHSAEPKVKGKNWNASGYHTHENGATWAYELGRQSEQCPLIVEDLDHPGQMLIEMQCEDYGLFLDIAQVAKHLKLTVLKGILDTKSNKPWARFIVETPRGFHRMEILWPLVQLLQQNSKPMAKLF